MPETREWELPPIKREFATMMAQFDALEPAPPGRCTLSELTGLCKPSVMHDVLKKQGWAVPERAPLGDFTISWDPENKKEAEMASVAITALVKAGHVIIRKEIAADGKVTPVQVTPSETTPPPGETVAPVARTPGTYAGMPAQAGG